MPQDTTMVLAQVVTLILEASGQLKQATAASLRGQVHATGSRCAPGSA